MSLSSVLSVSSVVKELFDAIALQVQSAQRRAKIGALDT